MKSLKSLRSDFSKPSARNGILHRYVGAVFGAVLGGVMTAGLMLMPKSASAFPIDFPICAPTGSARIVKGAPYEEVAPWGKKTGRIVRDVWEVIPVECFELAVVQIPVKPEFPTLIYKSLGVEVVSPIPVKENQNPPKKHKGKDISGNALG
jgi:hypothetical protein